MLPPFISDAKDKHPTFIFSVIWSRMLPPFISDAKDKHPTFILASYGDECYRHSFPMLRQTCDTNFFPRDYARIGFANIHECLGIFEIFANILKKNS